MPSLAGAMSFNEAKRKAENLELDGVNVPIRYDDLIKNKTLTNRLKDLADIEELAKRKKLRKKGLGLQPCYRSHVKMHWIIQGCTL